MGEQWRFRDFGLDHLERVETPVPEPGPGEVRLAIRAISLNFRDLLMIRGHYDPRVPRPLVPCSDGVGVIDAVGDGVDSALVGQRRMAIFAQDWLDGRPRAAHLKSTLGGPLPGMLQTHRVVPLASTVGVPDRLSDAQASTLPCAGVTAWHALKTAGVTAGSTVATLGTGGVSIFALQLAKAMGARVAITSSSDDKLKRARSLGAEHTVRYDTNDRWGRDLSDWAASVRGSGRDGAAEPGVDAVVEVGGAGTMANSLRAVRVGGTIALIGVLDGAKGDVPLVHALMRSIHIAGIFVGSRAHTEALSAAIDASTFEPVVDEVFPFEQAPAAFAHLESGAHFGKVVVEVR